MKQSNNADHFKMGEELIIANSGRVRVFYVMPVSLSYGTKATIVELKDNEIFGGGDIDVPESYSPKGVNKYLYVDESGLERFDPYKEELREAILSCKTITDEER